MESDLPQVHQGHSSFFLFKSKPSGIPASTPIPFLYTEYASPGYCPHSHSSLFVQVLSLLDG